MEQKPTSQNKEETEKTAIRLERHKAINEYLRFLTTLSTGSIVLLTSFLEKLTIHPKAGYLIGISLVGFTVSITASVLAYTVTTFYLGRDMSDEGSTLSSVGLLLTWLSFLIAIIALTVFALLNFN